jgi:hypothetical protein
MEEVIPAVPAGKYDKPFKPIAFKGVTWTSN